MGGKNSGRYRRGIKKVRKNIELVIEKQKEPVISDTMAIPASPKPSVDSFDDLDFVSNANRIAAQSAAAIEEQKPEVSKPVTEEQKPEVVKKESYEPIIREMILPIVGDIVAKSTGFPEMNYTKEEREELAPAISDLMDLWFPDLERLTPAQRILIMSSMKIIMVHVQKFELLTELKKKAADEKTDLHQAEPVAS